MKIAMVTQRIDAFADDVAVTGLTRTLARQGHQVTIFTSRRHRDRSESATGDGVKVVRIPAAGADDDLLAQVPSFSGPLHARLRDERPDVVHALNWTSGLAALTAARDIGLPVVQTFSALGEGDAAPEQARRRLEPAIGRSAQAVTGTSTDLVSDLARMGVPRTRVRCIPWGVDTDVFTPEGPAERRNGKPRLLAFGSAAEREPLETLIWALTKIPDAELMITAGASESAPPPDEAYLKLAASIGLSGRVLFTGPVTQRALPALIRSADLVLTACGDPSGLASVEAMACGKPVLAPPSGAHRDAVVDGTTGLLIPPGRPMLLAQRIRRLLDHPILLEAYGVAGADRARSRYSWDRIADETVAVYDRAQLAAA